MTRITTARPEQHEFERVVQRRAHVVLGVDGWVVVDQRSDDEERQEGGDGGGNQPDPALLVVRPGDGLLDLFDGAVLLRRLVRGIVVRRAPWRSGAAARRSGGAPRRLRSRCFFGL